MALGRDDMNAGGLHDRRLKENLQKYGSTPVINASSFKPPRVIYTDFPSLRKERRIRGSGL